MPRQIAASVPAIAAATLAACAATAQPIFPPIPLAELPFDPLTETAFAPLGDTNQNNLGEVIRIAPTTNPNGFVIQTYEPLSLTTTRPDINRGPNDLLAGPNILAAGRDINGNGTPDFAFVNTVFTTPEFWVYDGAHDGNFFARRQFTATRTIPAAIVFGNDFSEGGNASIAVLSFDESRSTPIIRAYNCTGPGFPEAVNSGQAFEFNEEVEVLSNLYRLNDIDNNGIDELAFISYPAGISNPPATVHIVEANGRTIATIPVEEINRTNLAIGDLTGDGKDNILLIDQINVPDGMGGTIPNPTPFAVFGGPTGQLQYRFTLLNQGFPLTTFLSQDWTVQIPGDFNRDGLDDITLAERDIDPARPAAYLNRGNGNFEALQFVTSPATGSSTADERIFPAGDLDSDGTADLITSITNIFPDSFDRANSFVPFLAATPLFTKFIVNGNAPTTPADFTIANASLIYADPVEGVTDFRVPFRLPTGADTIEIINNGILDAGPQSAPLIDLDDGGSLDLILGEVQGRLRVAFANLREGRVSGTITGTRLQTINKTDPGTVTVTGALAPSQGPRLIEVLEGALILDNGQIDAGEFYIEQDATARNTGDAEDLNAGFLTVNGRFEGSATARSIESEGEIIIDAGQRIDTTDTGRTSNLSQSSTTRLLGTNQTSGAAILSLAHSLSQRGTLNARNADIRLPANLPVPLQNDGVISIDGGTNTISGSVENTNTGLIQVAGNAELTIFDNLDNQGPIILTGPPLPTARLTVFGDLTGAAPILGGGELIALGQLLPNTVTAQSTPLELDAKLIMGPLAQLNITIADNTNTEAITVLNDANLAGQLNITLDPSLTPTPGDEYPLITISGARTGTFNNAAPGDVLLATNDTELLLTEEPGTNNLTAKAFDDADRDRTGTLDFFDVLTHLKAFDETNPSADRAPPQGQLDQADTLDLLNDLNTRSNN